MSMKCHLLILLFPAISLCGATVTEYYVMPSSSSLYQPICMDAGTEYYLRPTESTNTSCPAQPCLALNQYIEDSDYYFKSNTVFKFLPGIHYIDQPLVIGNVHNMSLENLYSSNSEWPHLEAEFPCNNQAELECIDVHGESKFVDDFVCCHAIWIHNSQNITLKGMSITLRSPGMSGITFQNVSTVSVQLMSVCSLRPFVPYGLGMKVIGILLRDADFVEINSSDMAYCEEGFVFQAINNLLMTNITAMYNDNNGVAVYTSTNVAVISAKAMHNGYAGMYLYNTTDTTIMNASAAQNVFNGINLKYVTNATISKSTAMSNGENGINMMETRYIDIISANLAHNAHSGIIMSLTLDVSIINISTHALQNSEMTVLMGYISIVSSTNTAIFNSSFTGIGAAPNAGSSADPATHPAVIALYESSLYLSGCNFIKNGISAVKAYASNITVSSDLVFFNNTAIAGTAFILVQNSILRLAEYSHIHFSNNHAIIAGGVFYITENVYYSTQSYQFVYNTFMDRGHPLLQSTCFLNIEGERSRVRLTFVNNSAGKGGDILYGGQVALGLDGDWNCLESFRNISNMSQSGLSLITSDPSRVCLCNETGQPDCLTLVDPTKRSIYPGQSFNIPAVVAGQQFGVVAGSVYAQFLRRSATVSSPQLDTLQSSQYFTQEKCNFLQLTIFSKNEDPNAVLVLTATSKEITQILINVDFSYYEEENMKHFYKTNALDPMKYTNNPVYVNISILSCPPGFIFTSEPPFICDCNQLLQSLRGVTCHIQDQTISRSGLVWVGTLKDNNATLAVSEYCLFDYCNGRGSNVTLSEPDSQCNYNHSGTLCGGCQPGLSLALGSARCLPCSNNYLALLIPFALAGPALVFFIKLLDLTISQGTLNGLIFYANIIKANEYVFIPHGHTNPLTLFIAWINLDLGVETCFFHGLTAYTKTWLQFVFPVYIWSIAGLIIVIAKYSDRVAKVMGNNSVPVLATLFHLSYAKLLRTIITALSYTMLYSSQGHKAVWSADGNVDYLGSKHTPLFAVAVAAVLFLWLPYTLLLFLEEWLHRCNSRLIDHTLVKIKPFLDAHYGPLKGKHHYWFGTLLLVRAAILLVSALIQVNHSVIVNFCVSVSATILMFLGMIVYRNILVAMFDVSFMTNLALLSVSTMFTTIVRGDQTVAAYTLIGIAFVEFLGLIIFKVFSILKRSDKVMACLHRRQSVSVEDDWELYEQAALQREIECDTEQEDSDGSGSIESLPTY